MVTAHTARRSFATNSYNRGIPVQTIMHTTGHKTEKTFRKYLLLSGEEHAVIQSRYQDKELRETAEMKTI
jgi:integrase